MWKNITNRYHLTRPRTKISTQFLHPDNVNALVLRMQEEASIRKQTYGGNAVPTTYTVDELFPLFVSFLQKPNLNKVNNLNEAFHHHAQLFIASDVQHWRYAYDKYNREQLAAGYLTTQAFAQPFRRRLASASPFSRPSRVKKKRTILIPIGFNNLNSTERREAAMKEAGLI